MADQKTQNNRDATFHDQSGPVGNGGELHQQAGGDTPILMLNEAARRIAAELVWTFRSFAYVSHVSIEDASGRPWSLPRVAPGPLGRLAGGAGLHRGE